MSDGIRPHKPMTPAEHTAARQAADDILPGSPLTWAGMGTVPPERYDPTHPDHPDYDPEPVMHCVHWMLGSRCCKCESNDDDPSGECDLAPGEEPYAACREETRDA
jgi:hypothetical protein